MPSQLLQELSTTYKLGTLCTESYMEISQIFSS